MSWRDDGYYGGWAPYVPVAERRRRAKRKMDALRKKCVDIQPVAIDGRKIAKSFWGQAWCDHLESFSDFENRLPRGRRYVRNGSVCHLAIARGDIQAKVSGTEIYDVRVTTETLPAKKWKALKGRCGGQIGSLLELLEGRLSDHVMEVVTDHKAGLFPLPGEMAFRCSCPDWAVMCKHVAAVLYGVGARLDTRPELLFALRGVNHEELIETDAEKAVAAATSGGKAKRLAAAEIGDVFGIQIDADGADASASDARSKPKARKKPAKNSRAKKSRAKKSRAKKSRAKKKSPAKKVSSKTKTGTDSKPQKKAKKPAARKTTKKRAASRKKAKGPAR